VERDGYRGEDGRLLHETILANGHRQALAVGTSTGRSGIWMAWALGKTGGRLVTLEIDGQRHREAVAHFKEAGLEAFVDARLALMQVVAPRPGRAAGSEATASLLRLFVLVRKAEPPV